MKYKVLDDRKGYSLIEIMIVVGIVGVISAIAVPQVSRMFGFYRLSGDTRSISNSIAGAKLRAAREFSQVRVYVNLSAKTFHMEIWDKTNKVWTTPSTEGATSLSTSVSFGTGGVTTAPDGTAIAQAPNCTDDTGKTTPGTGTAVTGTSCVIFNSRGVPVNTSNAPTSADTLYVTDGTAVYGITVAATGMIRSWQTPPTGTPHWILN